MKIKNILDMLEKNYNNTIKEKHDYNIEIVSIINLDEAINYLENLD